MTARELMLAVKPLEAFGGALARIGEIAREATRLEQGLEAVTAATAKAREELATAKAQRVQTEEASAMVKEATDRACAQTLAEAKREAEALVAAARAEGESLRRDHAEWQRKIAALKTEHDAKAEALRVQSTDLTQQVNDLRATARRLAEQAARVA